MAEANVTATCVILAAGFGTRMKSNMPKVLHPLLGRPMIEWAVLTAEMACDEAPLVVVGHGKEGVEAALGERVEYAVQEELLGTGHAVQSTAKVLKGRTQTVVVTYGDMPLLQPSTLAGMIDSFEAQRSGRSITMAMLAVVRDDPQGFGRIIRDVGGNIAAIVEEADCTPEQKNIRELNPGIYCFDAEWLWENLDRIPLSPKGEYYLTDLVGIAVSQGKQVLTIAVDPGEVNGINTRVHLAHATRVLQDRILKRHMLDGVTIIDPDSTYIDDCVEIGRDAVILPGCLLQGCTKVGANTVIGPHSQIVDSQIGHSCRVSFSVVEEAQMGNHSEIGPFGHLRKGAQLAENVHLGNFGEVKNSYLGPGTKMGHFSYIGDTHIEGDANIGAGTITCNFDGQEKHQTHIGQHVFVGSDTLLVAPVTLGAGARTGAGSVVTKDVAPGTLVYGVPARTP